jgi:hypothetical protein
VDNTTPNESVDVCDRKVGWRRVSIRICHNGVAMTVRSNKQATHYTEETLTIVIFHPSRTEQINERV